MPPRQELQHREHGAFLSGSTQSCYLFCMRIASYPMYPKCRFFALLLVTTASLPDGASAALLASPAPFAHAALSRPPRIYSRRGGSRAGNRAPRPRGLHGSARSPCPLATTCSLQYATVTDHHAWWVAQRGRREWAHVQFRGWWVGVNWNDGTCIGCFFNAKGTVL